MLLDNISGAIFDMDGTLVNSLWGWDELWRWCGERFLGVENYRPDEDINKAVRTMVLSDAMDYIHEQCGFGRDGQELLDHFNEILPELYATKFNLKDGVLEFLEALRERGVPMCIASATETNFLEIARKLHNFDRYFCAYLSCATIGKGKEHPDIYEAALQTLGTERESTWVFEDSFVALETASSIGMPTVGIYDRYNFEQERLRRSATHYIAEGETMMKLL